MLDCYFANRESNLNLLRSAALAAAALVLLLAGSVSAQTLPHGIPDFSNDPARTTRRSVASGNWSDAATWSGGLVPTANQVVHVDPGHVVTVNDTSAAAYTIAVHGKLRFSTTASTRLTVTNLMVMGDHGMPGMTTVGELEVGTAAAPIAANVTAEIVIRNSAPGSGVADPEQFGTGLINMGKITLHGSPKTPTFVRVGVEPLAGHTTLTLEAPVTGWAAGDRVVLPDTRHIKESDVTGGGWINTVNQWEERTVQSISPDGRVITLTQALQYNHFGSRNFSNVLEFLPHVGNLTRNVILRSESATGWRGHSISVHTANTDIRFTGFLDLGRTTFKPLNTTTNLTGRYPIHMHHHRGPAVTPANGYQFTLIGNAVDGGSAATQFKWGIAIHNSHYGLIQDNVVYNYNGASIATEDGSESFNVFDHNFALRGMGEPNNAVSEARMALGTEAVGFWFRGPNNYVRNNVAANFQNPTTEAAYGFVYQFRLLGNIAVPNFKGADTSMSGQFTTRNGNNLPLLQFENNEVYGATQGGFTYWWVGSLDPQPYSNAQVSVVKDLKIWNTYNKSIYHYPASRITFDGLKIRGSYANDSRCCGHGVYFPDYAAKEIVIKNSDIQGVRVGVEAPVAGLGSPAPNLVVEDTFLRNVINVKVGTNWSVNGCWMADKLVVIRNAQIQAPPGRSLSAVESERANANGIECLSKLDEVKVYRLNGDPTINFQLYHPDPVVLPRPPAGCTTTRAGFDGISCTIPGEGTPPTPPTVTLSASPTSIASGASSTLSWTSTNSTTVSINQGIGSVTPVGGGTRTVSPAATTTYTITATGAGGSATAAATVTVVPLPTVTFSASPQTIGAGDSSTLTWTTTSATSVSIDQGIGSVTPVASGTRTVTPASTTTYTITVTGPGGSTTATATVTVDGVPAQARILWRHTSGANSVWLMDGLQWIGGADLVWLDPAWKAVGTGDYDGDGHDDIMWRHTSGANSLWFMSGTQQIGEGQPAAIDPAWQVAGSGDYNGDGRADLLWRHSSGPSHLWLMDGAERIGEGPLAQLDPTWQVVGSGDYNGDGRADMLWRHSSGTNTLWLMNGTERIGTGQLPKVDPSWQIVYTR